MTSARATWPRPTRTCSRITYIHRIFVGRPRRAGQPELTGGRDRPELAVAIGSDLVTAPECPARRRTGEASRNAQVAPASRVSPTAGCVASALVVQGAQDEPPRSQAMTAPALRSGKTIVRASANAIAEPLGQLIVVRGCPPTVDLEPVVRVADGFRCIHAHQIRIALTTPTHRLATQPPVGVLPPRRLRLAVGWGRCRQKTTGGRGTVNSIGVEGGWRELTDVERVLQTCMVGIDDSDADWLEKRECRQQAQRDLEVLLGVWGPVTERGRAAWPPSSLGWRRRPP